MLISGIAHELKINVCCVLISGITHELKITMLLCIDLGYNPRTEDLCFVCEMISGTPTNRGSLFPLVRILWGRALRRLPVVTKEWYSYHRHICTKDTKGSHIWDLFLCNVGLQGVNRHVSS